MWVPPLSTLLEVHFAEPHLYEYYFKYFVNEMSTVRSPAWVRTDNIKR